MVAIFKAESGLNPNSKGWNCFYLRSTGEILTPEEGAKLPKSKRISKACQPSHRDYAWSVDCGFAQINVPGKECPAKLFDVDHNLLAAKGKYQRQGKGAWSAYNNNSYKKHLAVN